MTPPRDETPATPARNRGARVPPPVIGLLTALGVWGAATLAPQWSITLPGREVVAGLLALLGVGVEALCLIAFIRARTTITPLRPDRASALVTSGLYAVSRNPMYLGMACLISAWSVWLGHPAGLIGLAVFVGLITRFQIAPEEAALRANFGAEFDAYAARVRRWI